MSNKDSEAQGLLLNQARAKDNRRRNFVDNNRIMTLIMTVQVRP